MTVANKESWILVTGGAGYLGSHTVVELLLQGYNVVVVDDLSNSQFEAIRRITGIAGRQPQFRCINICDKPALSSVFSEFKIWAVLHFAGYKSPTKSFVAPLAFYQNNVVGSCVLLETMKEAGCNRIIFSSSATVYDTSNIQGPVNESWPLNPISPYGRSKLIIEQMINDICASDTSFSASILRYFNPVGAHKSGLLGESGNGAPANLVPYISGVLVGRYPSLTICGSDYPTRDGTGIRDYIHVTDLALAHIAALQQILKDETSSCHVYNIGTGIGFSVLEVVREMELASGKTIKCIKGPRRPGDSAAVVADPKKANVALGWRAKIGLREICASALKFQFSNPCGYNLESSRTTRIPENKIFLLESGDKNFDHFEGKGPVMGGLAT